MKKILLFALLFTNTINVFAQVDIQKDFSPTPENITNGIKNLKNMN